MRLNKIDDRGLHVPSVCLHSNCGRITPPGLKMLYIRAIFSDQRARSDRRRAAASLQN